jgi:hypothetical protein
VIANCSRRRRLALVREITRVRSVSTTWRTRRQAAAVEAEDLDGSPGFAS